jgi:hypothetical protein
MTRVVVVTGANRDIGQEVARQLAPGGDAVVFTARNLGKLVPPDTAGMCFALLFRVVLTPVIHGSLMGVVIPCVGSGSRLVERRSP